MQLAFAGRTMDQHLFLHSVSEKGTTLRAEQPYALERGCCGQCLAMSRYVCNMI